MDKSCKRSLVYGFGINDADYPVTQRGLTHGRWVQTYMCPYYARWKSMLRRCYGKKESVRNPNYKDCTVCDEWLTFSNFKVWMKEQDWKGRELDKDLLVENNKIYSPETSCFVLGSTNKFLINTASTGNPYRGTRAWGSKFVAYISNPITNKVEYLGSANSRQEAHELWRSRKREIAEALSSLEADVRVSLKLKRLFK